MHTEYSIARSIFLLVYTCIKYTISLVQYTILLGARPVKAGSYNVHYHINDFSKHKEKSHPTAPGNMQSMHAPWEPHTNWGEIKLNI